jgi:Flp pilus assembly protein TadG
MVSLVRGNRGQSVVEFALVLPLLLLILFGITEFGRAWMTANILTSAAREGARLAVVTEPGATYVSLVQTRVTEVCAAAGVKVGPGDITVSGPYPNDPQRRVAVTVRANFQVLSGDLLGSFSGTIPLRATSVMRHETL